MKQENFDPMIFQETAKNHPLWSHEFLGRCQEGKLTPQEVSVLSTQMYKFCKKFNRILVSIMHCCKDEAARAVIAENLYEELGEGDPSRTHPALFRRFTRELGIDDKTLEATPTEPETGAMIDTYFEIVNRYGYLAALSAVCYASEGIVGRLYSQLREGILATSSFPKESLEYFNLHIDCDDGHAEKFAEVVESRVTSKEEADGVIRAIHEAMDARIRFLDGVQHRAREITESSELPNVVSEVCEVHSVGPQVSTSELQEN